MNLWRWLVFFFFFFLLFLTRRAQTRVVTVLRESIFCPALETKQLSCVVVFDSVATLFYGTIKNEPLQNGLFIKKIECRYIEQANILRGDECQFCSFRNQYRPDAVFSI